MDLVTLLSSATRAQASDIHLRVGRPPIFRINGELRMLRGPIMTPEMVNWTFNSMASPERRALFDKELELDFSYQDPAIGRFRVNVLKDRSGIAMVIRIIHGTIPGPEAIGLPAAAVALAHASKGLVIIAGPAASGRSTTLASLLEVINNREPVHILTIEDPIEFILEPRKAVITQREVGGSTRSAATALSHAMHQDPDVIALGELRDLETISLALAAAEAGHLVFATMHTTDAPRTVDRLIDGFPAWQQQQVRTQLANTLQGIICQQLMPRADGRGQVAARELLLVNDAVRPLIREGKIHQLYQVLEQGARVGMMSMDRHLQLLINHGVITLEVAQGHAANPSTLKAPGKAPSSGSTGGSTGGSIPPVSSPSLSNPSISVPPGGSQSGQTGAKAGGLAGTPPVAEPAQDAASRRPSLEAIPAPIQESGSRRIVVDPQVMASLQDSGSRRVSRELSVQDAQADLAAALGQAELGSSILPGDPPARSGVDLSLEVPGPSGGHSWVPTSSGLEPGSDPANPSAPLIHPTARPGFSSSGGWDASPQVVEIPFLVAQAGAHSHTDKAADSGKVAHPAKTADTGGAADSSGAADSGRAAELRPSRPPRPIGLVETRKLPTYQPEARVVPPDATDDEDDDEPAGATRRLSPGELEMALKSLAGPGNEGGSGTHAAVARPALEQPHVEIIEEAETGEDAETGEEPAAEHSVARRLTAFLDDSEEAVSPPEVEHAALTGMTEEVT